MADSEPSSRPTTASRREMMAKRQSALKGRQSGLIMSTGNKPRRPVSAAGRRPMSATSVMESVSAAIADIESEVSPIEPLDVEEMELGDATVTPMDTKKTIFEKKLELSGLEQSYDPKDVRWKEETSKPKEQKPVEPTFAPGFDPTVALPPDFVFQPAPEGQKVMCRIRRDKSSVDKSVYPTYLLYLETRDGRVMDTPILAARKRKKAQTSYYIISTDPADLHRESGAFAAKLRANFVGTHYTLYDNGVNPSKRSSPENAGRPVREELAAAAYETNVLGFKGPRKMTVVMPTVKEGTMERNKVQPLSENDGLLRRYQRDTHQDLMILRNKKPDWNEATNSYVLNFGGRVTRASVKNFQIVHESDENYIILQFGRVEEHGFTMDFQYPMSALQAFGICLSSFDGKIAVE
eukprot:m.60566 g.60566  ORF g.60566 m.60566 type:complete len:408 (+) comp13294_c0_seq1:393-1616(+)